MNFKQRIEDKGIKQSWLAGKIGISDAMLSLYLSGERSLSTEKEEELKSLLS